MWDVVFDPEFAEWLKSQDDGLRVEIIAAANLLGERGPNLGRPYVDMLKGSSFANLKELRLRYRREPWRILFAFDPERRAVLLVGGNKAGDLRWYRTFIPIAEARFRRHLDRSE